jgi:hypothetical protein
VFEDQRQCQKSSKKPICMRRTCFLGQLQGIVVLRHCLEPALRWSKMLVDRDPWRSMHAKFVDHTTLFL